MADGRLELVDYRCGRESGRSASVPTSPTIAVVLLQQAPLPDSCAATGDRLVGLLVPCLRAAAGHNSCTKIGRQTQGLLWLHEQHRRNEDSHRRHALRSHSPPRQRSGDVCECVSIDARSEWQTVRGYSELSPASGGPPRGQRPRSEQPRRRRRRCWCWC
jgi:hypothetical protein